MDDEAFMQVNNLGLTLNDVFLHAVLPEYKKYKGESFITVYDYKILFKLFLEIATNFEKNFEKQDLYVLREITINIILDNIPKIKNDSSFVSNLEIHVYNISQVELFKEIIMELKHNENQEVFSYTTLDDFLENGLYILPKPNSIKSFGVKDVTEFYEKCYLKLTAFDMEQHNINPDIPAP